MHYDLQSPYLIDQVFLAVGIHLTAHQVLLQLVLSVHLILLIVNVGV